MNHILRYSLVIFLLISISFTGSFAQNFAIGLKGGGATYFGDLDDQQLGPYGGMSFEFWLVDQVAIQFLGSAAHLEASENNPIYNPGIVVADWPECDAIAQVKVSEATTADVQQGVILNTEGAYSLVLWIEMTSDQPVTVKISI